MLLCAARFIAFDRKYALAPSKYTVFVVFYFKEENLDGSDRERGLFKESVVSFESLERQVGKREKQKCGFFSPGSRGLILAPLAPSPRWYRELMRLHSRHLRAGQARAGSIGSDDEIHVKLIFLLFFEEKRIERCESEWEEVRPRKKPA